MEKRIFTLVFVVALGVLIGTLIAKRQVGDPILQDLALKQSEILKSQSRVEKMLGASGGSGVSGGQLANVLSKQTVLENRITSLEKRIDMLQALLGQAKGSPSGNQVKRKEAQRPPVADPNKVYDIKVAHSPIRGKVDAPVTIVEFADLECPFCARFHPAINQILEAYPNKVNYIIKNFPLSFHKQARPAAWAAFAAGEQGKYYEMIDLLLENGKNLNESKFEELAKQLKLNIKKFKKDYSEKTDQWEKYISDDMALGSSVSVRGTPTFFINGRKTRARDFNAWKLEVEAALKDKK